MKVLFIGPDIKRREDCRDFGSVWSFYLSREFKSRGIEVVFSKRLTPDGLARLDLTGVQHVIAIGHWFAKAPAEGAWILAERIPGAVAQISDRVRSYDPVDVTFTVLDDKRGSTGINVYAGWAADEMLCAPRQDEDLRILIDHQNYGTNRIDHSVDIVQSACDFALSTLWHQKYTNIKVRRIEDGAVRKVDLVRPTFPEFTRQHIPFEKVCEEYSKAHVFLVTHPESAGMSVLETALAGALPVVPKGFIAPELLQTVRHLSYEGDIPWGQVLKMIDPRASRKVALANSWTRVAERILTYLKRFS